MSLMSEFLSNIVTTIAGDIKALFSKFDTNGKLIKANLPALTKADVGLGNVDNTADANKSVASAGMLTTSRRIELIGGVTGYANFRGSSDVIIHTKIASTILRAVMGSPSGSLNTTVAHGLDPARIKAVYAKVEAGADFWVWQNHIGASNPPNYAHFFTARVSSAFVHLEAHSQATEIHGKPVTIFIENY